MKIRLLKSYLTVLAINNRGHAFLTAWHLMAEVLLCTGD